MGYIISRDRYLKRDELGVVYQLCVAPNVQRKLVGASLLKAVFEGAAYGCRLYCCWCAQDLAANYFWESLGFVPIAFRGGSGKKRRVHIFWQRRIREGDATTPWWFPAKTDQGAMREDRLVLPIPPGVHWRDPMPVLKSETPEAPREPRNRVRSPEVGEKGGPQEPTKKPRAAVQFGVPTARPAVPVAPDPQPQPPPEPAKTPRPKERIDPQLVAKARELRDRYLEHVNGQRMNGSPDALPATSGRYDVSRALPAAGRAGKIGHELHESARMIRDDSCSFVADVKPLRQLPAAA
ncbi:MAG TPA: GNAT family N-acetyltransferase [Tepidisphaeraceae bacterium]|nr:GNAT family N-acetyltransferase [Tepidisphaeraceae bacterium]